MEATLVNLATGASAKWDSIKTIAEEDLKPKRPYRTYIQMYVYGSKAEYNTLAYFGYKYLVSQCCRYLENHPERIEELIKERVRIGNKLSKNNYKIPEWLWLFLEMQIANTWRREDVMKFARGGATVRVTSSSLLGLSSSLSMFDECLCREETVPKQEPAPGYLPVSEELPKKNMACLVSVGDLNLTKIAMYSDLMGTIDRKIFYQGEYGHGDFRDITKHVKAWQPLPKRYEEKGINNG